MKNAKKILIVEDEPVTIRLFEKNLTKGTSYQLILAKTAEAAINKAKNEAPDIILLDVMLPDVNGLEVAKMLKQYPQTEDIPIVFMTAQMNLEDDDGKQTIDVDGKSYKVFAKPLHTQKMLSVIRKEINKSQNKS